MLASRPIETAAATHRPTSAFLARSRRHTMPGSATISSSAAAGSGTSLASRLDAGPLANARYLEPLGMLNIWLGYMGGRGANVAPRWDTAGSPVAV